MAPDSTAFRFDLLSDEDRTASSGSAPWAISCSISTTATGKLVDHPINKRVMSIPIEQLRDVPKRMIASGGNEKVDTLLGAIKLIDCNVLITNEATAREIADPKDVGDTMLTPLKNEVLKVDDLSHEARRFRTIVWSFQRNLELLFKDTGTFRHGRSAALAEPLRAGGRSSTSRSISPM